MVARVFARGARGRAFPPGPAARRGRRLRLIPSDRVPPSPLPLQLTKQQGESSLLSTIALAFLYVPRPITPWTKMKTTTGNVSGGADDLPRARALRKQKQSIQ